jgi:hypothetical protein
VSTRTVSNNPVTFRALIPKKLNVAGMTACIRDAAIKAALDMGKDLKAVTRTWKGEEPVIMTEAKLTPPGTPPYPNFHTGFTASAWPKNDGSRGYLKWLWLDLGTKVRYAVMSNPFIAKTRAGKLQSWAGKGGRVWMLSKKNKQKPMPGIKPRKFTKALRVKWEKKSMFRARMAAAVKKAAKASGHGVK